jgi:tetratricopeptide (TPR) repeat protein
MEGLAATLWRRNRPREAEQILKDALSRWQRSSGLDTMRALRAMNELGNVYRSEGRNTDALQMYQRAAAGMSQTLGADDPQTLSALSNLASALGADGRFEEAKRIGEQVLAVQIRRFGRRHPRTMTTLNNLADIKSKAGSPQALKEASREFRTLLKIQHEEMGEMHPMTLATVNNLAVSLIRQEKYEEAIPMLRQLVAARMQQPSAERALRMVVCGLPQLTDNLALAKSYSERMFQAEVLDALQAPEDLHAFVRPLAQTGRAVGQGLPEAVRADTRGYPFHVQFYGALLWDSVPWPEPITCDHFQALRPAILEALDHAFFDARVARTSPFERRLLQAIAVDGEAAYYRAVFSRDVTKRAIARLVIKGLIYRPERGRLAFAVPLFGDYMRRKVKGDG